VSRRPSACADPGATLRRNVRSILAGAVAVTAAFALSTAVTSPPGLARPEGKAIPLVRDFTLAPAPPGWSASVSVVDFDGGEPLTGADVQLKGAGLPGLTPMRETESGGTYRLALPKARAGEIRLTLRIRALPGGSPVADFDDTYVRTLVRGEPLHIAGGTPPDAANDGADAGMFVGGAGALLIVAVICSLLAIRSRPPATARGR
jgi:hypothetical protein